MNLLENWKKVALKAWSMRLWYLSIACQALEVMLPSLGGFVPERTFTYLSAVAAIAGIIARLIPQEALHAPDA